MKLALLHARAMTFELLRYPAYLVPTLALPPLFFLFFVAPGTHRAATAPVAITARMATFAGFAVIGVAFFQFGVGIAIDRGSAWEAYLRTLPIGPKARLGARLLSAAVFATAAAGLLVGTAISVTGVSLPWSRWVVLAATLITGTIPFALLGISLGYLAPAKGALPLANLLYLVLAYAGGLWIRPGRLPSPVAALSPYLPTRAFSDALVGAATAAPTGWRPWFSLAAFSIVFGCAAAFGYRRDEGRRFS